MTSSAVRAPAHYPTARSDRDRTEPEQAPHFSAAEVSDRAFRDGLLRADDAAHDRALAQVVENLAALAGPKAFAAVVFQAAWS